MFKLVVLLSFFVVTTVHSVHSSSMNAYFPGCSLLCGDSGATSNIPGGNTASDSSEIAGLQNEIAEIKLLLTEKCLGTKEMMKKNRLTLCGAGMQDFTIKDSQISASSNYPENHYGDYEPRRGRLFASGGGGHWAAASSRANEWIQVDLGRATTIYGIVTQGTYLDHNQYVTSYNILYRTENSEAFKSIVDGSGSPVIFKGNTDASTPVINNFAQPVTARTFRINVITWNRHVCMRFDLLTC